MSNLYSCSEISSSNTIHYRDIKNDETGFCLVLPIDYFIKHDTEAEGTITQADSWGSVADDENDGNNSIISASPSKKNRSFPLLNKSKRTEVTFHFRAMLDGNEKFIWLQAASELGRLCSETVKPSMPLDVKKWVMLATLSKICSCYSNLIYVSFGT